MTALSPTLALCVYVAHLHMQGDDLGLNGFFDRVGQYGSRLVEAANEHVLTGHIAVCTLLQR